MQVSLLVSLGHAVFLTLCYGDILNYFYVLWLVSHSILSVMQIFLLKPPSIHVLAYNINHLFTTLNGEKRRKYSESKLERNQKYIAKENTREKNNI